MCVAKRVLPNLCERGSWAVLHVQLQRLAAYGDINRLSPPLARSRRGCDIAAVCSIPLRRYASYPRLRVSCSGRGIVCDFAQQAPQVARKSGPGAPFITRTDMGSL